MILTESAEGLGEDLPRSLSQKKGEGDMDSGFHDTCARARKHLTIVAREYPREVLMDTN